MKIAATISSYTNSSCPFCDEGLPGLTNFVHAAKHLQEQHGLSCMHVGQQTGENHNGEVWHHTVAVFGSDDPPTPLTDEEIRQNLPPELKELD
jgi:hypothetical protein